MPESEVGDHWSGYSVGFSSVVAFVDPLGKYCQTAIPFSDSSKILSCGLQKARLLLSDRVWNQDCLKSELGPVYTQATISSEIQKATNPSTNHYGCLQAISIFLYNYPRTPQFPDLLSIYNCFLKMFGIIINVKNAPLGLSGENKADAQMPWTF